MRTSLARLQTLGFLVLMVLVSASCTTAIQDPTSTSATKPEVTAPEPTTTTQPPKSIVLSAGILSDLTTTNIWSLYGREASFYDSLVLQGQPASLYTLLSPTYTHAPLLAESAEVPIGRAEGDGWVVEVQLRQDLTWSDGEPIDAHDVVFTFETVKTLNLGGSFRALWPVASEDDPASGLVSVVATADHTVAMTWNAQPGLGVWRSGAALAPILPEHHWAQHVAAAKDADDLYETSGIGAPGFGATLTTEHQPGVLARNVANESYPYRGANYTVYANGSVEFSHPELGNETWGGAPSGGVLIQYDERSTTSEALFNVYLSQSVAAERLIEGDIDVWLNPLPMWRDLGGLRRDFVEAGDLDIVPIEGGGLSYMAFNTRRFPGNNVAFRRAVDCMVDKSYVTEDILNHAVIISDSMVPPTNTSWHNPDVSSTCAGQTNGERMVAAVEILKNAGWSWEREPVFCPECDAGLGDVVPGEGLTGPNGESIQPIRMAAPSHGYDSIRATYALWLQVFMTELGVPVMTEPMGVVALSETIEDLDWDMYVFGWELGDLFPSHLVTLFHSRNDSSGGGANSSGYSSSEFDALADEFNAATDSDRARELSLQMQEMIASDAPVVVLYTTNHYYVYRKTLDFPFIDLLHSLNRGTGGLPGLIKRS